MMICFQLVSVESGREGGGGWGGVGGTRTSLLM